MTSKFIKYTLLLVLAILSAEIFWPRHYEVPALPQRSTTQYWDLPTGSRIAYTLLPAKEAKKSIPILYLHGGPGGPITDGNIQILTSLSEDGFDVYLYDQIGGGFSERLDNIKEYTADRHKLDLEAIVQKIGASKVILIGQSWGAILATLFVADNPNKIEKLIFTSPGPIQPGRSELKALEPPDSLHLRPPYFSNAQGNQKANNLRTKTISFFASNFGIKLASDKEADDFATYLNQELNKSLVCDTTKVPISTGGAGFYVQVQTLESFNQIQDPRPPLKQVHCPVLVMKGQCDSQKWGYTKEYLDLFPQSQLVVIPDAGHAIGFEQPALYLKTIREFLNR